MILRACSGSLSRLGAHGNRVAQVVGFVHCMSPHLAQGCPLAAVHQCRQLFEVLRTAGRTAPIAFLTHF
jgi:hypothetical protein